MKKKIIIAAVSVIIIGLFIPIPKTYVDGTKSYNAIAYKIVNWNRPFYKNLKFTEKTAFYFPHSLKSVDALWESLAIDPPVSEFKGVVVDTDGNASSVEVLEGDGDILPGEIVTLPSDDLVKRDVVKVEYLPEVSKEKGSKIGKIVDVEKENKSTAEKETTLMYEDSAVFFKSTRECQKYIITKKTQLSYDEDAGTVNEIFGRYKFKVDPYDNLPDYEITLGAHIFYYESSSGIVTDSSVKKPNAEESIVLSRADRDTINGLIKKYSITSNPTMKASSSVFTPPTGAPDDSFHRVRLSWDSSADYPQVVFVRNRAQYDSTFAGYTADGEDVYNKKYSDKFFEDKALVVIFTSESSGSNYYTDVRINSGANEVYITRFMPDVRTCDMASWAVIKEVSASDPILSKDNTKTAVLITK